jgi:hypothetical protein
VRARYDVDEWRPICALAALDGEPPSDVWREAGLLRTAGGPAPAGLDLRRDPQPGARFATLPAAALRERSYRRWEKQLVAHLYRHHAMVLWRSAKPKLVSEPGEVVGDFRARLVQLAREQRDLKIEKLRTRYAPKLARLEERIRKAEQRVDREKSQYDQQKMQTAISIGATILGGLFGRKVASSRTVGRATTAMRGAGRAAREKGDIARARENLEALRERFIELDAQFREEIDELSGEPAAQDFELDEVDIKPRKSDTQVVQLALVWQPWVIDADGIGSPAFEIES